MTEHDPSPRSRRDLFRSAVRYATLGAVTVVTAGLVTKRVTKPTEAPCVNRGICRQCAAARSCNLPAALSFRDAVDAT
ncbi:MAG: hypothetical protein CMJ49_01990 [Planctomycetaceae bacterium]|nr:hypothetical protein [Planctomycetaceae bacterium]